MLYYITILTNERLCLYSIYMSVHWHFLLAMEGQSIDMGPGGLRERRVVRDDTTGVDARHHPL